jgi:hypothetical protein
VAIVEAVHPRIAIGEIALALVDVDVVGEGIGLLRGGRKRGCDKKSSKDY